MSDRDDNQLELELRSDLTVSADLERRLRARHFRVEQRLALLRELREPGGLEALETRIDTLEQRMRTASRAVISGLRGAGR